MATAAPTPPGHQRRDVTGAAVKQEQEGGRPPKIPESVLVVIYTVAGEVLLMERADHLGSWQSVTGSKEVLSEGLEETARREVHEETGIVLGAPAIPVSCLENWAITNVYDIYARWRHRYAPGVTQNTEHVFGLRLPSRVPVVLSAREHVQSQWLPIDEAAQRCFSPSNAQAIATLKWRL